MAASSEVTIETLEARGPDDIPRQQIVTSVRAVRALAPDTMLLHLQTPRSHRLRFLAGQSVTLGLSDGDDVHAEYSIASCPCDDRNLHFFVARDAADPVATRLFGGGLKGVTPSPSGARAASSCSSKTRIRSSSPPATPASRR